MKSKYTIKEMKKLPSLYSLIVILLLFGIQGAEAQTIGGTNINPGAGGSRVPTGWTSIRETCDISTKAAWTGNGSFPWAGTVLDPPNGHTTFLSGVANERASTVIGGLTAGRTYKLTFHIAELRLLNGGITPAENFDGEFNFRAGNTESGTTLATYNFTGGSSNAWTTHAFIFTATGTSFTFNVGGKDRSATNPENHNLWNLAITANAITVCEAGTAAPTLSATTISNACPATKINLTTLTASNKPSAAIITWHTGTPATAANRVATPSSVDPGTYHAAFFDEAFNCYSGLGSATTSVTATFASCCNAGTVAPAFSATTISNACPANKVNLTTLTASNKPSNLSISWHTGTPATTANLVSTPTAVNAGIYYAAFFDSALNCYSGAVAGAATTAVNATVHSCVTVDIPALINTTSGTTIPGIEPLATGGIAPFNFTFTDGSSDAACVAPSGFTSLTGAGGTINNLSSTTGQHTVTAPANAGSYFYCIKVCDANSCTMSIHTVNVVAACPSGNLAPTFN